MYDTFTKLFKYLYNVYNILKKLLFFHSHVYYIF